MEHCFFEDDRDEYEQTTDSFCAENGEEPVDE